VVLSGAGSPAAHAGSNSCGLAASSARPRARASRSSAADGGRTTGVGAAEVLAGISGTAGRAVAGLGPLGADRAGRWIGTPVDLLHRHGRAPADHGCGGRDGRDLLRARHLDCRMRLLRPPGERLGYARRQVDEAGTAWEREHGGGNKRGRRRGGAAVLTERGAARQARADVRPERGEVLGSRPAVDQLREQRRETLALAAGFDPGDAFEERLAALGQASIDFCLTSGWPLGVLGRRVDPSSPTSA
jgi:hypothetical protein